MMLSNNLSNYVDDFFENLVLYDDHYNGHNYKNILKSSIDCFLDDENNYNALSVYEIFLMIYQITSQDKIHSGNDGKIADDSNIPLDFAKIMFNYEKNNSYLSKNQKDGAVNSVEVFILGLAIYSQNNKYREYFKNYVVKSPYTKYYRIDNEFSHEEFLYRWGLASLFHDIAGFIEITGSKPLRKILNEDLNHILNIQSESMNLNFLDLSELDSISKSDHSFVDNYNDTYPDSKFLNLFKPTDILAHKIFLDFGLNRKQLNSIRKLFNKLFIEGDCPCKDPYVIDHGFVSAIAILDIYGYILQKYHNDELFFYPIVDSASAILLHTFYNNILQRNPFNLKQLHPSQNPLLFLLILCDELQEANRKSVYATLNKSRLQNELNLILEGNALDVEYNIIYSDDLKSYKDKEYLINDILSIKSIFDFGIRIFTRIQQIDHIPKSQADSQSLSISDIEKFAIEIHQQHNYNMKNLYKEQMQKGKSDECSRIYENLVDFNDLSSDIKLEYIRQARSIPKKLRLIGCELTDLSDEREVIERFSDYEINNLAIFEHDEWCQEKIGQGWTYGKIKDNSELTTPYLIPWNELPVEMQKHYMELASTLPQLIKSVGFKIVFSKIKLLSFEMHNLYDNNTSFEELPDHIKYSNYKQTDYLIKNLSQNGYLVVDIDSPGSAIEEFDKYKIEYFAKMEHEAWYQHKISSGWTFGPIKDEISKINPNLVPWNGLTFEIQESNRSTIKNLPDLCKKVGLKIVEK